MWLLRRKTSVPKVSAEVLPAVATPMRRIEITVERQWLSRVLPVQPDGAAEQQAELQRSERLDVKAADHNGRTGLSKDSKVQGAKR